MAEIENSCAWPELAYRLLKYFRWEPQHNGASAKDFKRTVRRLEVPLNYFFLLLLRWSSPHTIRILLRPFEVNESQKFSRIQLAPLLETDYTQPDVCVESERARIFIEIKRKYGKIKLHQVQKYLLLHAEMDQRSGEKEPFLFFLTPDSFAKHWSPATTGIGDVVEFLRSRVQAPLGKLEERISQEVLARHRSVQAEVQYRAATWQQVCDSLVGAQDRDGPCVYSETELRILADFVAEVERRGMATGCAEHLRR